ncbi:MAG: hypothetical protein JKY48_11210, partial [Flavobacteriales bacterium]|nr:hypothetical protein [Flavobacteriales bacterium]
FFALVVLIRPINGIILMLLPFLAGSTTKLYQSIQKLKWHQYGIALLIAFFMIGIQAFLWYVQTGNWILWSYGEEGFYFGNPQFYEVLFGFRKGWFIYTPMALLSCLGFYFLYKSSKSSFFFLFAFILLLIYLTASWWNWFYGSSFGQRPFVDFYALLAFLFAFMLHEIKARWARTAVVFLAIAFIGLNLVQTYQYKENLISSWDMTFKKYRATFLATEVEQVRIGGNRDLLPYRAQLITSIDTLIDIKNNAYVQKYIDSVSGVSVADFNGRQYNLSFETILDKSVADVKGNYLNISLKRLELDLNSSENAKLVVILKDSLDQEYYSYWFLMNEVPEAEYNQWESYEYQVLLPSVKSSRDRLVVFIQNEDKASFYIDEFRLKLSRLN